MKLLGLLGVDDKFVAFVFAKISKIKAFTEYVRIQQEAWYIPIGDEITDIDTGVAIVTFRAPYAMKVTGVKASLTTASSVGLPTVNIFKNAVSILTTLLSIDATEKTSMTAAAPAVLVAAPNIAADDEITVDITVAGTGAKGLKLWIQGTRI